MREDNLLCLRSKPFVPYTTNSRHEFSVVPNLTRGLVPTGLHQIWAADITYVRLAVVLDTFSRKVVGWALADHLTGVRSPLRSRRAVRLRCLRRSIGGLRLAPQH